VRTCRCCPLKENGRHRVSALYATNLVVYTEHVYFVANQHNVYRGEYNRFPIIRNRFGHSKCTYNIGKRKTNSSLMLHLLWTPLSSIDISDRPARQAHVQRLKRKACWSLTWRLSINLKRREAQTSRSGCGSPTPNRPNKFNTGTV
jgi:hypothetical protein